MFEVELTKFNFTDEVINSDMPVMVDFWATWCGPCKMLMPTVEEIANEYNGKIKVGKINVDDEMELAMQYKIEVIPTLLFFKDGKVVKKTTGVLEKKEIQKIIAEL